MVSAERLRAARDKPPTRQVLMELLGAAPDKLDLGPWVRYPSRHYDKEFLQGFLVVILLALVTTHALLQVPAI